MDLDELRVILAIAETGSVLAASEKLKLTRTTLRRRLDELEARVGKPLVLRGPAGMTLTEAGHVVVRHARTIVQESNALLASARDLGDDARGVLRVAIPVGMPPLMLSTMVGALHGAHPQLAIDARVSEDPLAGLFDDLDLVFYFGARLTEGPWITRVVRDTPEVLVASPAYLANHGCPRTPDELRRHHILSWRRPGEDPGMLPLRAGGSVAIEPGAVAADVHTLRCAAEAGVGIAFVPEGRLPGGLGPAGDVVEVMPELIGRDCALRMAAPEPLARAPKVRRVLEEIASVLREG